MFYALRGPVGALPDQPADGRYAGYEGPSIWGPPIGIRKLGGGSSRLIRKLNKRSAFRSSAPKPRPYFCRSGRCVSFFFSGPPFLAVSRRATPAACAESGPNLKDILTKLNATEAARYSTSWLTLGAPGGFTEPRTEAGGSAYMAGWHSEAMRAYLQFRLDGVRRGSRRIPDSERYAFRTRWRAAW